MEKSSRNDPATPITRCGTHAVRGRSNGLCPSPSGCSAICLRMGDGGNPPGFRLACVRWTCHFSNFAEACIVERRTACLACLLGDLAGGWLDARNGIGTFGHALYSIMDGHFGWLASGLASGIPQHSVFHSSLVPSHMVWHGSDFYSIIVVCCRAGCPDA